MPPRTCRLALLLAAILAPLPGQQAKTQPKPSGATATGTITGRSGKPLAKARLTLGELVGDQETIYAKIRFPGKLATVTTDDKGKFQMTGFTPGTYTIVYQLAGAGGLMPTEIPIKPLAAVTKSIMPLMRGMEIGRSGEPYADRAWGQRFTILKGHTFYLEGTYMKVFNATVRLGQQGPYLEIRRGIIWMQKLDDKSQISLDAWSY